MAWENRVLDKVGVLLEFGVVASEVNIALALLLHPGGLRSLSLSWRRSVIAHSGRFHSLLSLAGRGGLFLEGVARFGGAYLPGRFLHRDVRSRRLELLEVLLVVRRFHTVHDPLRDRVEVGPQSRHELRENELLRVKSQKTYHSFVGNFESASPGDALVVRVVFVFVLEELAVDIVVNPLFGHLVLDHVRIGHLGSYG